MRLPLASLVVLLALTASAWGCQGAQRPAEQREPAAPVSRPRAVEPAYVADVTPASSAKAEATAEPTSAAEPVSEATRLRAAGSTRKRVACGEARCATPNEQCVSTDEGWRCIPSNQNVESEAQYACDDASDCARGQACCLSFVSAFNRYACTPRSGSGADCRLEVCVQGDGAPCPADQRCQDSVCQALGRAATCEGGQRCPPEAPVCVFANGAGRCASALEAQTTAHDGAHASLFCSKPSDCGPNARCCTNALWDGTACLTNCDAANNGQLCTSDSDCAGLSRGAAKLRCLPAHGEEVARALPSWLRLCALAP